MKNNFFLFFLISFYFNFAQNKIDTTKIIQLNQVEIDAAKQKNRVTRLNEINDAVIVLGKKNEVIHVSQSEADLSTNNARQVFAKIPGVNVWENDGSGIQVAVATRGLSPNRSWEFNVRQNGYDISSEVFGYPEAYYNPPMEAVDKIEIIRGAASLAYGPQFGGLLNYKIKQPNPHKMIEVESRQTIGSFGLYNAFNAIGGTFKKFSYYAYYHHRHALGWRENSRYNINSAYIHLAYQFNTRMKLSADYTSMNYLLQQPGGLTDSMFAQNARQSIRSRNWFSTPWNVASLNFDYNLNEQSMLSIKNFVLIAERNSVGYLKSVNVPDVVDAGLNDYNNRQIDRDFYKNIGNECRYLQKYSLFNQHNVFTIGTRYYKGNILRKQGAIGTRGSGYELFIDRYQNGFDYARNLNLKTENFSMYMENLFRLGKHLNITCGFRYENIVSEMDGRTDVNNTTVKNKLQRSVYLWGSGLQLNTTPNTNLYANYTQAFRPVLFSELMPSATTEIIDANLKDVKGFNADVGWRGNFKGFMSFDIGAFYMLYDNRIGIIQKNNAPFKTNIGTSVSRGVEIYLEINPIKIIRSNSPHELDIFISYAYNNARYVKWNDPSIVNTDKNLVGKSVEYAPGVICRWGLTYHYKFITFTYQFNYTDAVYTDAKNTDLPNATATIGKIPSYTLMDASVSSNITRNFDIKAGVNNITNEKYATRRAGGYPGPGLIPGNGRSYYFGLGVKF